MSETTSLNALPKADEEYIAAIDRDLAEIKRLAEEWEIRQQKIEKSQAETRAMLEQMIQLQAAS